MTRRTTAAATAAVAVALVLAGCSETSPEGGQAGCLRMVDPESGKTTECLPVAPKSKRVDLAKPTFSHPLRITNPLHPTSEVDQVIYGGEVDGKPFRTEFTRLSYPKTITWRGKPTEVAIMQYLAFSDGRIHEVALDWFAQDDAGNVWYFGEDVFNYENGAVADTAGTWMAGRDGPAAMIMPADPKPGDVYRPENIPDKVFEEVTVREVDQRVDGPSGPVDGAITVSELHMDNTRESKTFAPGYGEYATSSGGDVEQASLAMPTDQVQAPPPAKLKALSAAAKRAYDAVAEEDWPAAKPAVAKLNAAWQAYAETGVPELLGKQMTTDVEALAAAVEARKFEEARGAALRVAQNDLDLRLRHSTVEATDLARAKLWARQLEVDLEAKDTDAAAGDALTLHWTWDRVRHTVPEPQARELDQLLDGLKASAEAKDAAALRAGLPELRSLLS
jgi:hypothetical protein